MAIEETRYIIEKSLRCLMGEIKSIPIKAELLSICLKYHNYLGREVLQSIPGSEWPVIMQWCQSHSPDVIEGYGGLAYEMRV